MKALFLYNHRISHAAGQRFEIYGDPPEGYQENYPAKQLIGSIPT